MCQESFVWDQYDYEAKSQVILTCEAAAAVCRCEHERVIFVHLYCSSIPAACQQWRVTTGFKSSNILMMPDISILTFLISKAVRVHDFIDFEVKKEVDLHFQIEIPVL